MGDNPIVSIERRVDLIKQSNQENKYSNLVGKLIQLEPNNWPEFQEHLKNYIRPNFSKHKLNESK